MKNSLRSGSGANGERAVWIIVVINALQFVGKTMIVMIAGLQGIPEM